MSDNVMSDNTFRRFYRKELAKIYKRFLSGKNKDKIIILDNIIGDTPDLQSYFEKLKKKNPNAKILVTYYNHLWEPVLKVASGLGLRRKVGVQNWLDEKDIKNLLDLSGYEVVSIQKRVLIPFGVPLLTNLANKYLAPLPVLNSFCLITLLTARPKVKMRNDFSVSIIIPARNEEKNIAKIIPSIPKFGKSREFIFVEGHSNDSTWNEIQRISKAGNGVKIFKQKGTGKADAVKLGLSKTKNDILMIYDADRTVPGADLLKFYNVLAEGMGEFANGSRLVYPMESQAMQTLNKIGNKFFSVLFSWILKQRFKDTLCGTKAFFRKDYINFKHSRSDPFGDFDLIFGAVRNNLKVVEIPVRYKEREYGSTNIKRFKHGLLLFKTVFYAYKEFILW